MAMNKAQSELQDLIEIGSQAQGQASAAQEFAAGRTAFDRPPMDEDGKADFLHPDMLKTAVGAGWLLGPVGGVLMGVAQGILGQRERQNAIDEYARETGVLKETGEIFNDQIDRLAVDADPETLDRLDAIRTMYQMGQEYSSTLGLEEDGMAHMAEAAGQLQQLTIDQQKQTIQDRQLMDANTRSVLNDLKGDFRTDSAGFEERHTRAMNIIEAVRRGDGAAVTSALASMPLLINDQAGATSDAEVKIWQGVRGQIDKITGLVDKELGAGGLTDKTRKQLIGVAEQYMRSNIASQTAREAWYGKRLVEEKIPEQRWGYFNRTGSLPGYAGGGFISRDKARPAAKAAADAVGGAVQGALSGPPPISQSAIEELRRRSTDPKFTGGGGNK